MSTFNPTTYKNEVTKMEKIITKEMLTDFMKKRDTVCEKVNNFICPTKKLQPHKGARLDGIHNTSECYWSAIVFPQWVKLEPSWTKSYRFICDKNGEFIQWVNLK